MKKKSTTIVDIANKLDIDVSTVSRALKDHPKISDSTKEKVLKTAEELNYSPNSVASALVKGTTNMIGVMVPSTDENFFASVIRGIEETAREGGYRMIIMQSGDSTDNEKYNIETMLKARVDGILASLAMETNSFGHYQKVIDQGIPLILFDRFDEEIDANVVAINDFRGAYKAVKHLIEQGCKKIIHFSGYRHVHIYQERFRGYKEALLDHELLFDEKLVYESNMKLEHGRELMKKVLSTVNPLPDAIFCANDYVAIGAIQVLKENNIDIPDQVAIAGFSNEGFSSFVTPTLTSVDQHSTKMGRMAAKVFLDQINGSNETDPIPKKMILSPELKIRESSVKNI